MTQKQVEDDNPLLFHIFFREYPSINPFMPMYFPIPINWTSPIPILRLLGGSFHLYSNFKRNFCKQTVENLIRRTFLRCLILFCTVCRCPTKRTLGLYILLTVPRRYFFYWIFCVSSVLCLLCAFVHVCLYVPCGHLLGKGCLLGSCLWCLTVSLSLSHWYPGSGVVVDCIDS